MFAQEKICGSIDRERWNQRLYFNHIRLTQQAYLIPQQTVETIVKSQCCQISFFLDYRMVVTTIL